MATIKQTIFRCDSCGKNVEAKRDIVQFRIEKGVHSSSHWRDTVVGLKSDICGDCEEQMFIDLERYFGEKVAEILRRKPKPVPKAKKSAPAPAHPS